MVFAALIPVGETVRRLLIDHAPLQAEMLVTVALGLRSRCFRREHYDSESRSMVVGDGDAKRAARAEIERHARDCALDPAYALHAFDTGTCLVCADELLPSGCERCSFFGRDV